MDTFLRPMLAVIKVWNFELPTCERAVLDAGATAPDASSSTPGEHRLLEVRDPRVAAVQPHLEQLVDERRRRRVNAAAEQR